MYNFIKYFNFQLELTIFFTTYCHKMIFLFKSAVGKIYVFSYLMFVFLFCYFQNKIQKLECQRLFGSADCKTKKVFNNGRYFIIALFGNSLRAIQRTQPLQYLQFIVERGKDIINRII